MQYLAAIRSLEKQFKGFTLQHVDRAKNEEADALAKVATRGEALPSDVFYHVIGTPAVRSPEGLQITDDSEGQRMINLIMTEDWRAPITLYLQGYYHPVDSNEAKRLHHRSRDFALIEGQLYKKGVSQPMLKCVTETEGIQILREVHRGTCGSHAGPRALAAKVIRQGFYWPAIICAANQVVRSCEACQKFSPRSGRPSQFTKLIAHTRPLQCWGLDIVGPQPTAQGNLKFTFVAVEYFTKWIEARAVSTITSKTAQKFFLAKYCLPLRSTIRTHGRQRQAVRQPRFQRLVLFHRHQACLRLRVPSPIQRSRGARQRQNFHSCQENAPRRQKRQVARPVTRSGLGTKYN
jgi:hypothetical protein